MPHPRPIELIEHVAGRGGDAGTVREHVRQCSRCAEYVESIRATWEALGRLPSEPMTTDLLPRIEQSVAGMSAEERPRREWWSRLRLAAAVLLAVGVGHLAARGMRPDGPPIDDQQAAESIYLDVAGWRSGSMLVEVILDGPDERSIGGNG